MKKIVSALIIFAMIGALGCGLWLVHLGNTNGDKTVTVQAAAPTQGTTGDLTDWWLIPDYDTLNHPTTRMLMGQPGNKFKITGPINFPANTNWMPIPTLAIGNILCGGSSTPWEAQTVDGLRTTAGGNRGLFDNMLGTVQNLVFTNVALPTVQAGTNNGVVAGRVSGTTTDTDSQPNGALIENVTVQGGTVRGLAVVGGIVGSVSDGARLTLSSTNNFANIMGQNNSGGLIGEINGSRVHITNSMNGAAEVNASIANNTGNAGGIVARIQGGSIVTMDTVYNRAKVTTSNSSGTTTGGIIGDSISYNSIILTSTGSTGIIGQTPGHAGIFGIGPATVTRNEDCFYDISGLPEGFGGEGGWSAELARARGQELEAGIRRLVLHEITILPHTPSVHGYSMAPVAANLTNRVWDNEKYSFTVTLEAAFSKSDFTVVIMNSADTNTRYTFTKAQAVSVNGLTFTFTTNTITTNMKIGILQVEEGSGLQRNTYTISTTTPGSNNPSDPAAPFWFVGSTSLPVANQRHGDPFTFQIQVGSQHNQATRIPTVTALNITTSATSTLTGTRVGDVFTYVIPGITSNMSIAVVPQINVYSVTIPSSGQGYNVFGSGTFNGIQFGDSAPSFSVNFLDTHENYSVLANGQPLQKVGGGALATGLNSFDITNVDRNITITISATLKVYTVTTTSPDKNTNPNAGFTYITDLTSARINHGSDFSFSILVDAAYSRTPPEISINSGAITFSTQQSGNMWTYLVTNVRQHLSINVFIQMNRYTIRFVHADDTEPEGVILPQPLTGILHGPQDEDYITFQITLADSHSATNVQNLLSVPSTFATLLGRNGNVLTYRIIGRVESHLTITVTATRNVYNVNIQLGAGMTGLIANPRVEHGAEYSFRFDLAISHEFNTFQITNGYEIRRVGATNEYKIFNTSLTPNASDIRHDISISITASTKIYGITFVGGGGTTGFNYGNVGQNASGYTTRQHGQSLNIIVLLDEGRTDANFTVTVNSTTIPRSGFTQNGAVFLYTWSEVTESLSISVHGDGSGGALVWNKYSVNLQQVGQGFSAERVGTFTDVGFVWHNDTGLYTFVITFNLGFGREPTPPTITTIGGVYQARLTDSQLGLAENQARYEIITFIRNNIQINIVAHSSGQDITLNNANNNLYTTPTTFPAKVNYNQPFTFIIVTGVGYNVRTPIVTTNVSGIQAVLISHTGSSFTFRIAAVTSHFEITVQPLLSLYDVTVPVFGPLAIVCDPNTTVGQPATPNVVPPAGTNFHSFIVTGANQATHGSDYQVTVRVHEHYDIYNIRVIVDGGTLTGGQLSGASDPRINITARTVTYTIGNVYGPVSFNVAAQLTTYNVRFIINGEISNSRDGVTVTGPQTIRLGDSYEFEIAIASSHTFPAINPFGVTNRANAALQPPPHDFRDLPRFMLSFGEVIPGIFYTGYDVDIQISSVPRTFSFSYTLPQPPSVIDSYSVQISDGSSLSAGVTHHNLVWGTQIDIMIKPQAGRTITHIIVNNFPVFFDIAVGATATYSLTLYENTVVSFEIQMGVPVSHNVTFRENGGTVTNSKFNIIGDETAMGGEDYVFIVELNAFHSKSAFEIVITRAGSSSVTIYSVEAENYAIGVSALRFRIYAIQTALIIDIRNVAPNIHTITIFPSTPIGFTITNQSPSNLRVTTVNSAGVFTFTVTLAQSHRLTPPAIRTNGGILTYTQNGRSYNYILNGIMYDIDIDITATPDVYNISLARGNAATLGWVAKPTDTSHPMKVGWHDAFWFNVIVESSHSQNAPIVNIPGIMRNPPEYLNDGSGRVSYMFIVSQIEDHINITVDLIDVRINTYTIYFADPESRFVYKYTDNSSGEIKILETSSLTREHGEPLIFSIELAEGWTQSINTIKIFDYYEPIPNKNIDGSISGMTITYAIAVTYDVTILIRPLTLNRNQYDVHFPPIASRVGYQVAGNATATFGLNYTFVLDLLDSHNFVGSGILIRVNGTAIDTSNITVNNNLYTINGAIILGAIEVTVYVEIKRYAVNIVNALDTAGTHFVATIPTDIQHGTNLTFSITMQMSDPYYLRAPKVTIAGTALILTSTSSSGTTHSYLVPWEMLILHVTAAAAPYEGQLTIDVTPQINQYRIDMPMGGGYISSYNGVISALQPTHLVDYMQAGGFTFTITVVGSHNKSTPRVMIAGERIMHTTGSPPTNAVYTFTIPADLLTANRAIAVFDIEWNRYIVTMPAVGPGFTTSGPDSVLHIADGSHVYEFTVTMLGSHNFTATPFTVTGMGNLVPVLKSGSTDTYTIANISSDITIGINTVIKVYNITRQLGSGDGFVFEGGFTLPTTREHGTELAFTINLDAKTHHLLSPKMFIGEIETPLTRIGNSNRYTFATTVTKHMPIRIETYLNEYTIIFPNSNGFTVSGMGGTVGNAKITHGYGYWFSVELHNSHHIADPKVCINDQLLSNPDRKADGYTFIFSLTLEEILLLIDADGFLIVTIEAKENTYTITLTSPTGNSGWFIGSDTTTEVLHTDGKFIFWVQLGALQQTLGVAPVIDLTASNGAAVSQIASQIEEPNNGRYMFEITNITNNLTVNVRLATIYKAYFLANFPGSNPDFDQYINGTAGQPRRNTLEPIYRSGYEITRWVAKDSRGAVISVLEPNWTDVIIPENSITYRAEWNYKNYALASIKDGSSGALRVSHPNTARIGDNSYISIPSSVSLPTGGMISWEALIPDGSNVFERFASSTERTIDLIDYITPEFFARHANRANNDLVIIRARHISGEAFKITALIDGNFGKVELENETINSTRPLNNKTNIVTIVKGEIIHLNFMPDNNHFQAEISKREGSTWTQWTSASTVEFNSGLTGFSDVTLKVRFISKNFLVNFSFADDNNTELPTEINIEGIDQQYEFQLDSNTGAFLLTLAIDNLNDIQANGFSFGQYVITSGEQYIITSEKNGLFHHSNSLLMLEIDSNFLDKFLDTDGVSIEITAQFLPMRTVKVEFLGSPPFDTSKFAIYTVVYDEGKDESSLLKAPSDDTNIFAVGAEIAIGVISGGHLAPTIGNITMSRSPELRNGVHYLYFRVPDYARIWDEGLQEHVAVIDDLLVQIGFEQPTYNIAIERRVGTDVYLTEAYPATVILGATFPGIHFNNTKQPTNINFRGETYFFTGWHFRTIDGRTLPTVMNLHVDESGNVLTTFFVNTAFIETYVGPHSSTNTITLVAMYGESVVLNVNVSGGMDVAGALVTINSEASFMVYADRLIEVSNGDEVRIHPIYNALVYDSTITAPIAYTVSGTRTVSFKFTTKTHSFTFGTTRKSGNGKLQVQINGETVTSPSTFTSGDIITFSYETGSLHNLDKLYISNGVTNRILIGNGQPFVIDNDWLANWVVNGELKLDFKLDAKTKMEPTVLSCMLATIIVVPLVITFAIVYKISSKKKRGKV